MSLYISEHSICGLLPLFLSEETRRLVLGIAAGLLAHQIFGLTDAFMLGTKPGIVMWILMGIITGLYLNLAPAHLRSEEPDPA